MTCPAKHTAYQPTEDEWQCPHCGKGNEAFHVADWADGTPSCEALHEEDGLYCNACDHSISGKVFAEGLQAARNLVTCTCCQGTGLVPKDAPKAAKARKS
jgi:hypothetical protein